MAAKHTLSEALKTIRKARGLSQEAFSNVSSRTYMSSLERDLKSPTLNKLAELCEVTRRRRHLAVDRRRRRDAPRPHGRGTRPDARHAHPGLDLPAGAGPRAAPLDAPLAICDDGAASRAGNRDSCAGIPKPEQEHRGATRRGTRPSDTKARCGDRSWRSSL